MKSFVRSSFALLAVAAVTVVAFAEANAPKAPSITVAPPAPAAPAAEPNVNPNDPAVTVNGTVITEGQVEAKMAPRLKAAGSQVPPQYVQQFKKQLHTRTVDGLVIEHLLSEQVKKAGITVSDANVDAEIAKQLKEQNNMSIDDFKQLLQQYGLTLDGYKQQLKQGLAYQKLLESKFAGETDVNNARAEQYYKDNINEFKTPEEVCASHILIKTQSTEPNADPNKVKAQAKKTAEDVLAQVNAKDANFAALAQKYSGDPGSASKGGDLGCFGKGRMVKPFEDAAFSLKPGQTSGLVESQFGFHIIKVTGHKDANTVPLAQAIPTIKERLSNQKKGELAQKYVTSLKDSAKIVYPAGKEPPAPPAMQIKPQAAPAPAPVAKEPNAAKK